MPGAPAQGEAIVVWTLLALDALAVLITYSLIEPSELYNVSSDAVFDGAASTRDLGAHSHDRGDAVRTRLRTWRRHSRKQR
jgi:hypothetical protein